MSDEVNLLQSAEERREVLKEVYAQAQKCVRCQELASTRKNVVFGAGNADADLMFIGEAPGASEDEQGLPFVGAAGKLLEKLLGEIGLERKDVFIGNVLKCLRYNAMVQLGDGTWERIGRLVRSRYSGEVMSVDEHGMLVSRRVTGWHATPLAGRRVFRLTYGSCKNAGASRVGIQLTGDHPVLTERGYVPVEELRPSDRIATGQGSSNSALSEVELLAAASPREPAVAAVDRTAKPYGLIRTAHSSPMYYKQVTFDRVEVQDVTIEVSPEEIFFCIDVEGTHNFVTAGGVVHNCRPPGNRDPQPIEIENCREYLYRQVELIQPKVICTLGNFSTKLLRGDPTGITRLHGQPEVLTIGRRAVRLYPIFHPAAALYTPTMLETLRTDFLRLPELLQLPAPEQPPPLEELPELEVEDQPPVAENGPQAGTHAQPAEPDQLGLF